MNLKDILFIFLSSTITLSAIVEDGLKKKKKKEERKERERKEKQQEQTNNKNNIVNERKMSALIIAGMINLFEAKANLSISEKEIAGCHFHRKLVDSL